MDELAVFGTIVLVVAGGLLLALLLIKLGERFPVPEPVIFLLLAAVASDMFPQLAESPRSSRSSGSASSRSS